METHSSTDKSSMVSTKLNDDSFEVILKYSSLESEYQEISEKADIIDEVQEMEVTGRKVSFEDNIMALNELTSPYSTVVTDNEELEDRQSDDIKVIDELIESGIKCIEVGRMEQDKLQTLLLSITKNDKTLTMEIDKENDEHHDHESAVNEVNDDDNKRDNTSESENLSFQEKNEDLPDSQFPSYLKIFENTITEMYPRIVLAVLIGFIVSFVLFLTYTVVFESMKMKQIQTFENMTKEERQEKEMYRRETDNFRETLMHKSYEEARQSTDELRECQKEQDNLKVELSSTKNDLFRSNLEARELEKANQVKLETLRKVIEELRFKNKEMANDLIVARKSWSNYDYSVVFGLLVGFIAIFAGIRK